MIKPLPLFATREWGTRYQEKQVCPNCHVGRLRDAPICPSCFSTSSDLVGSMQTGEGGVASVYECTRCGTVHEVEGRNRLECDSCSSTYEEGWHRHHYDDQRPSYIRGRVEVEDELYATVQHYLGRPEGEETFHLADFVIDIDRDGDMPAAVDAAIAYAEYLDSMDTYYRLYFSGGKGFHIQVPAQAIGAEPHDQLNSWYYKKFAEELQVRVGHDLDMAIYTRRRMLRVEGSMHGKTGLWKIGLSLNELKLRRETVIDLAKHPPAASRKFGSGLIQEVRLSSPLHELYLDAISKTQEFAPDSHKQVAADIGAFGSDRHVPCVKQSLEEGPPGPGTRHRLTFNMAAYWTSNGLDPDEFMDWARDVPGASDSPASERMHDASGALRWSQSKRPPFRCKTMQDMGLCDPQCPFYTGVA